MNLVPYRALLTFDGDGGNVTVETARVLPEHPADVMVQFHGRGAASCTARMSLADARTLAEALEEAARAGEAVPSNIGTAV